MKALVFLLVASLVTLLGMGSVRAQSCGISDSTCEFYNCMEKKMSCGPNGYFQDFGHPYCQKFVDDELLFSKRSQVWLQDVRYCLQDKVAQMEGKVTCDTLHNEAMHSHVACYVDTGFCDLKLSEQYKVYWYLKGALRDARTWQEALLLNRACLTKNPAGYPMDFLKMVDEIQFQ